MESFILQPWTTIRGVGAASVVQTSVAWLDLERYSDIVLFTEVKEVTNPGSGSVVISYETAPLVDDGAFQAMAVQVAAPSATPLVTKVLLGQNPPVPLARFVRWRLAGTQVGTWDVTFRVVVLATTSSAGFTPAALSGCIWWLRADQGTNSVVDGSPITSWNDISGSGDGNRNLVQSVSANQPTYVASDGAFSAQPTVSFVTATHSQFLLNAVAWNATFPQPWSIFIVGRNNVAGGNQYFVSKNGGTPRADIFDGGPGDLLGATGVTNTILTGSSVTNASVFGVLWNGATSNIYVNARTPAAVGNLDTSSIGDAAMCVGTFRSNDPSFGLQGGRIAEIVAYSRGLSSDELSNLFGYFGARYGISIGV